MSVPLWIDCDPGQDDVVAIALAAYNPHIKLIGLSTVHGNSSLENTTRNALRFLTAINRMDVPVYPGSPMSLRGSTDDAPEVHGKTGLNGSNLLPEPRFKARSHEEFFPALKRAIEETNGELCIAAVAPLTNIALFFEKYPELRDRIRYLVIMGGGFNKFNRKGVAEFNIFVDSLAASEILSDKILAKHIILAPLDMTSQIRASVELQGKILGSPDEKSASNFRALMYQLVHSFYLRVKQRMGPDYVGPSVHDPPALASLLYFCGFDDDLDYKSFKGSVKVVVGGEKDGATILGTDKEITILTDLNRDRFWELILEAYQEADKKAFVNTIDRSKLIEENKP
ncbi:DEKNAAC101059 [Brettanomyces naardenensis]|uniref:DEKNAAC101059 n=1 Tax=Brettanomyces naardenensis TaxID=13370 RepID=A0A448YGW1_BRENA|nr:DEKNAAC101059 [Brettanomyces naardenensis]